MSVHLSVILILCRVVGDGGGGVSEKRCADRYLIDPVQLTCQSFLWSFQQISIGPIRIK